MDIVRTAAAAHGRTPIAHVHDAIFFKQRLGTELKAAIEKRMRAETGNAYWHLTAKELQRYESRHLDQQAEEALHRQRIAYQQALAQNYVPKPNASLTISVG